MILNLNNKEICKNTASVTALFKFSNVKDWTFVDCTSTFFKLNILNDSDSVKSFRSAWVFAAIFWVYCFKRRARCRFWRRNIVVFASRSCWLKEVMTSSFCCIIEFLFSSALRWQDFSFHRIFFSKLLECDVWTSINSSSSNISFKIRLVWSDIVNYVSDSFFRKIKRLKL